MAPVIEIEGLRKEYRHPRRPPTVAVDGLSLSVPEGGVFGFLGPNGSGKTTTIRSLLGLVAPTAGRCRVLGAPVPRELPDVVHRVGSIVETPAFFPNFSGRRNLLLLARVAGLGATEVDAALERVGLAERARDRVKAYSLGMRQRLGVAAALLKDPELLVLDEPANGLDPAGIREIRDLLTGLGAEGRTVFVSSHLLAEVQQTCDRVAIVDRGSLVATGSVDEVLRAGRAARMLVRVEDPEGAASVLAAHDLRSERADDRRDHLIVEEPPGGPREISRILGEAGHWVDELRPHVASLEDVFLELTADPSDRPPPRPPEPLEPPEPSPPHPPGDRS